MVSGKHLSELHWHAGSWEKRNTGFKISDSKRDLLKRVVSLTFVMPSSKRTVWTSNTVECHCPKLCATGSQFRTRCRKIFISGRCLLHTVGCVLSSFVFYLSAVFVCESQWRKFWWRLKHQVPLGVHDLNSPASR